MWHMSHLCKWSVLMGQLHGFSENWEAALPCRACRHRVVAEQEGHLAYDWWAVSFLSFALEHECHSAAVPGASLVFNMHAKVCQLLTSYPMAACV